MAESATFIANDSRAHVIFVPDLEEPVLLNGREIIRIKPVPQVRIERGGLATVTDQYTIDHLRKTPANVSSGAPSKHPKWLVEVSEKEAVQIREATSEKRERPTSKKSNFRKPVRPQDEDPASQEPERLTDEEILASVAPDPEAEDETVEPRAFEDVITPDDAVKLFIRERGLPRSVIENQMRTKDGRYSEHKTKILAGKVGIALPSLQFD